jgi:hypothetical protein
VATIRGSLQSVTTCKQRMNQIIKTFWRNQTEAAPRPQPAPEVRQLRWFASSSKERPEDCSVPLQPVQEAIKLPEPPKKKTPEEIKAEVGWTASIRETMVFSFCAAPSAVVGLGLRRLVVLWI